MGMACRLLSMPLVLGAHPTYGGEITLHTGRFGPYVMTPRGTLPANVVDGGDADGAAEARPPAVMASLPKSVSVWDIDEARAIDLIDAKVERAAKRAKSGKPTARRWRSSKEAHDGVTSMTPGQHAGGLFLRGVTAAHCICDVLLRSTFMRSMFMRKRWGLPSQLPAAAQHAANCDVRTVFLFLIII
jgi:hypothetical protein